MGGASAGVGTRHEVRGHEGPGVGTRAQVGFQGSFSRVATPVSLPSMRPVKQLAQRGHQRVDGSDTCL